MAIFDREYLDIHHRWSSPPNTAKFMEMDKSRMVQFLPLGLQIPEIIGS